MNKISINLHSIGCFQVTNHKYHFLMAYMEKR